MKGTSKLIIFCVGVVLMSLVIIFGPKEEVLTWSRTHEEPPEAVFYYNGERTIRYQPDTEFSISFDPNCSFEIFVEPNEPRYYSPFDPRAYTCPKCYEGANGNLCPGHWQPTPEPNEPEVKRISDQYSLYDNLWLLQSQIERLEELRLKFIPTWPDYIELDKDLVIQSPWYGENWIPIIMCTLEKGTKIYFKEEE